MPERRIVQDAPWPDDLEWLIEHVRYREGWTFHLFPDSTRDAERYDENGWPIGRIAGGTTVEIVLRGPNSYNDKSISSTRFIFPVPAATFKRAAWRRWLFERIGEVELHERMEWFRFTGKTERHLEVPYAPLHGPGENPYTVHEYATEGQRAVSFKGDLNPPRG